MTRPERHRIQRQVVDLVIAAGSEAPSLQEAIARSLRERAAPELEAVFDRVAGPGELLRLDRLEIDLGRIAGGNWEPQFRHRLVEELTRGLARFRPATHGPAAGGRAAPGTGVLRQFLFFLSHGHLPWWGERPTGGWSEAAAPALDAVGWAALRQAVRDDARARARLVHAVDDAFLATAVARWAELPQALRVLERMTPAGLAEAARPRWRRAYWLALLAWVLEAGAAAQRGSGLMRALLALRRAFAGEARGGRVPEQDPALAPDGSSDPFAAADPPQPWREWLAACEAPPASGDAAGAHGRGAVVHPFARRTARPAAPGGSADAASGSDSPGATVRALRPVATRTPGERGSAFSAPVQDEAIYLAGAGAILLHPFIEQLFRACGLLAGRAFRDAEARTRGVLLLGLLAFARADVPEYELLLPKLLCGHPFAEPLESVVLEPEDAARCDDLLRAVLAHWSALRSTSPDWLRGQFLLREGKLEGVDDGMRLTVERRAQDVLLARLPWGIGVVALPWLQQRIFVHWLQ